MANSFSALPQAFWLVADDQIPLALESQLQRRLLACLIQGILYEGALVIPDSYVINNQNLRKLLNGSHLVRSLIQNGYVRVAARQVGGARVALPRLRDQFLKDGKRPLNFPETEFQNDSGLDLLEQSGVFTTYDFDHVAGNYTGAVMHAFRSRVASELLGERIQLIARQIITAQFERTKNLSYKFFFYDVHPDTNEPGLGALLDKHAAPGAWEQFREAIRELAHGPYITGLPDLLDLSPVYEHAHTRAIDLWRQRRLDEADSLAEPLEFGTVLDLSTYEQALLRVQMEDVAFLHNENGAWKEFRNAIRNLGADEKSACEAQDAFIRYRLEVERRIAKRLGANLREDAGRLQVRSNIGRLIGEPGEFVFLSLLNPILSAPLGALAVAWRTIQRLRRRDEASEQAERAKRRAEDAFIRERREIEEVAKDLDLDLRVTATTTVNPTWGGNIRDTIVTPHGVNTCPDSPPAPSM